MGSITKQDECPSESYNAIRCAKAAMLLLSLGARRDHQEKEMMSQTIQDLRMELVRERLNRKTLKLCNLVELVLQIVLLFSLSTFILMLAFKFG